MPPVIHLRPLTSARPGPVSGSASPVGPGGRARAPGRRTGRTAATVCDAQADDSWDRLKLCDNADCRWAFYDRSHSRRGAWCEMASCGNRLKNRSLRGRRAQVR